VRVLFSTAGVIAGVGDGRGTLTFHGKTYPFGVSGASFGATVALTVTDLEGRALNLYQPSEWLTLGGFPRGGEFDSMR
jgi:hypothetical protein